MAEGRAFEPSRSNANINYSLQDYSTSIEYFDKRLTIAKESNDQIGQRRAHLNLGNAYLYLEDFEKALNHYREANAIGELMNDGLFVAQLSFILGRVYHLKEDYEASIQFHDKHLNLARQFQDSKGQCHAYFLLSQLYEKLNHPEKAKKFLSLYKALDREIDQPNRNQYSRTDSLCMSQSDSRIVSSLRSHSIVTSPTEEKTKKNRLNFMQHLTRKSPIPFRKESASSTITKSEPDELVDLVCRMQKTRFDDQRCEVKSPNQPPQQTDRNRPCAQLEDIFNAVDRLQQNRLDDQRTHFPKPARLSPLNEQFFDQLAKSQDARMNDQRAVLLPLPLTSRARPLTAAPLITTPTTNFFVESTAKTLPDKEFFSLLQRLQTRQTPSKRKT